MNGRYLLDTNIVIALFANDQAIAERIRMAGDVFAPSIVLGELYYGAQNSVQVASNLARIEQFRITNTILVCDAVTAGHYGEIKAALKRIGTPIPENDIWIAAIAKQHTLTLVSRDQHFGNLTTIATEA